MTDRERSEKEFHDHSYAEDTRHKAHRFYAITAAGKAHYRDELLLDVAGTRVLEYGCGAGSRAFLLARRGAEVIGVDISEVAIRLAREEAEARGVDGVRFEEMNAHQLTFPDDSFDLVCGSAILHHLDLDAALAEIARVLRPGGRAVFYEPLGHNPIINWYRNRTPDLRTPDEQPLLEADLARAEQWFESSEYRSFHLATLAALPFRRFPGFRGMVRFLDGVDRLLFRLVPPLRKHAWVVVLTLTGPRRETSS